LVDLIYGKNNQESDYGFNNYSTGAGSGETSVKSNLHYDVDSLRFDVNALKLERYKLPRVKKMTKKKFVTGIAKDRVL
jgi:hypothetical protein